MSPEEIHRLGLNEVARIKRGMEAIKARVGFKGSLPKFFDYIRNDPKFKPASAQALGDGYRAIGERVAAAVPRLRSEEHTSELQSLMRISYAVFCLKKKKKQRYNKTIAQQHNTKYQDNKQKNRTRT